MKRPGSASLVVLAGAHVHGRREPLPGPESLLKTAVQNDPSNLPAYALLAQVYLFAEPVAGRAAGVRSTGSQGIAACRCPDDGGRAWLESMGKPEEARKRYEAALSLDPTAAIAANNLAWMTAETGGNLDVALQLAQTAKRACEPASGG